MDRPGGPRFSPRRRQRANQRSTRARRSDQSLRGARVQASFMGGIQRRQLELDDQQASQCVKPALLFAFLPALLFAFLPALLFEKLSDRHDDSYGARAQLIELATKLVVVHRVDDSEQV